MTQVSAPAQHEGQTSSAALFFALDVIAAGTIEYFTHLGLAPALEAANERGARRWMLPRAV